MSTCRALQLLLEPVINTTSVENMTTLQYLHLNARLKLVQTDVADLGVVFLFRLFCSLVCAVLDRAPRCGGSTRLILKAEGRDRVYDFSNLFRLQNGHPIFVDLLLFLAVLFVLRVVVVIVVEVGLLGDILSI